MVQHYDIMGKKLFYETKLCTPNFDTTIPFFLTSLICHHKGVSHDQIPVSARFGNIDLRNTSSGCDTIKYNYSVQNCIGGHVNISSDYKKM